MSRTKHHSDTQREKDFWSRRCFGFFCMCTGRIPKWITRKKERSRDKQIERQALADPENYEGRFPGE